jgi:WSC domain
VAEGPGNTRALTGASYSRNDMTPAVCQGLCRNGGFNLAAVEYGVECEYHFRRWWLKLTNAYSSRLLWQFVAEWSDRRDYRRFPM